MSSSVSTLSPAILSSQPIEVSNHEFLESIFCKASELSGTDSAPVCVSFSCSPAVACPADWYGFAWNKVNEPKDIRCNSYFSISAFRSDEHGKYRRKKSQFVGQFAIAFDDVVVISLKYANGLRNGANSDTHRCKQLTEHGEERCIKLREVAGFSAVRTIFQIVGPRKILHCLLGK